MTRSDRTSTVDRRTVVGGIAAGAFAAAGPDACAGAAIGPRPAGNAGSHEACRPHRRNADAIGLGTFLTFDALPGANRDALREVTRIYIEAGVRVVDTSPLYGTAETSVGNFLGAMNMTDQMFVANKVWSTGDFLADESHALRSFEQSQLRLWRERFDLIQCHSLVNVDVVVPMLRAWKKEGRTKFFGVTHYENDYHDVLAGWVERGGVDFVQVNYSIANRGAEERVFRVAADRGVGVLVNMPLEKARLHKIVDGRALPDFAREIGGSKLGAVLSQICHEPSGRYDGLVCDGEPGPRS